MITLNIILKYIIQLNPTMKKLCICFYFSYFINNYLVDNPGEIIIN